MRMRRPRMPKSSFGYKARPWKRDSPAAIMRYTRVTTDQWLDSLDNPEGRPAGCFGCVAAFLGIGTLLGTLIYLSTM
jgi:hypothetical protein